MLENKRCMHYLKLRITRKHHECAPIGLIALDVKLWYSFILNNVVHQNPILIFIYSFSLIYSLWFPSASYQFSSTPFNISSFGVADEWIKFFCIPSPSHGFSTLEACWRMKRNVEASIIQRPFWLAQHGAWIAHHNDIWKRDWKLIKVAFFSGPSKS